MPKSKPYFSLHQLHGLDRFIAFCGVGFGSGLLPKAPGTFGSAFALLFVPFWIYFGFYGSLILIILMSGVGIYICGRTAELMQTHDDGRIVWDEFAGQSITFLPLIFFNLINVQWALVGFLLFRLFDIWKPWPIRAIDQHVAGGFGIMLDDIIAGLWAALCILLYLLYLA